MIDKQTLQQIRKEYISEELQEASVSPNPVEQFAKWFEETLRIAESELEANSAALATAAKDGAPSVRMVLLKHYDENGFDIYTNYRSRKGRELAENPRAALLFYWPQLHRQVRIEGAVEKISPEESDVYFQTRPPGSQIGAWASEQSAVIENRQVLEKRFEEFSQEYRDGKVPRPPHWGGYRLIPNCFEFWQGRENRLHDRVLYTKIPSGWRIERLAP